MHVRFFAQGARPGTNGFLHGQKLRGAPRLRDVICIPNEAGTRRVVYVRHNLTAGTVDVTVTGPAYGNTNTETASCPRKLELSDWINLVRAAVVAADHAREIAITLLAVMRR